MNKEEIMHGMADLSFYLTIFIILITLLKPGNKILFGLILIDGVIASIGYVLLITTENHKLKNKGVN